MYLSNDDFYARSFPFVEFFLPLFWRLGTSAILRRLLFDISLSLIQLRYLFFFSFFAFARCAVLLEGAGEQKEIWRQNPLVIIENREIS